MKGTTKSLGQKEKTDKFYTKENIVKECLSYLNLSKYDTIIEPSAGNGAFLKYLPSTTIGYDIAPEDPKIIEQDFLKLNKVSGNHILIVGNPPFGVQSKLAIAFFNKSAEFAQTIAFILPKSFAKDSVQNKLSLNFNLEKQIFLAEDAFLLQGSSYSVPCVFQIWNRTDISRKPIKLPLTTYLFEFTKDIMIADFRIQRVGGNAGKAFMDKNGALSSNYYVINKSKYTNEELVNSINQINFPSITFTVGPKSLAKGELCYEVEQYFQNKT